MLLDIHIPDWDGRFLERYDPRTMVGLYSGAGLSSVMFYCILSQFVLHSNLGNAKTTARGMLRISGESRGRNLSYTISAIRLSRRKVCARAKLGKHTFVFTLGGTELPVIAENHFGDG